jgi:multicomponent Na+:H+ antiporter subunit A
LLSIAVGGVLALTEDVLKQLLAYSTISQYGYVVFMYGLGGEYGAAGAAFYVIAHALAKCALFLTAGAVSEVTGEDRLSRLGGMRKPLPLLAVASGAASAGLAALPLTIGFFKDELFFEAALKHGPLFAGLAVLGAALTFAYTWRFWSGLFLGASRDGAGELPALLVWPVAVLGGLVLLGGFLVEPFARLAEAAGASSYGVPTPIEPAYHFDLRPVNLMALGTFAIGALLVVSRPVWERGALVVSRFGEVAGPSRSVRRGHPRTQLALRLRPQGRGAGPQEPGRGDTIARGPPGRGRDLVNAHVEAYRVGEITTRDLPLLLALVAVAVAAVTATFTRRHVSLALVLSSAGFVLALVYAFFGAPDVALVAVLVETVVTLLLLGTSKLIPYKVLRSQAELPLGGKRWRRIFFSSVAGAFAFAVVWGALSQPAAETTVAEEHIRLAPEAHAKDVVTAILADFRGLDTLGEITVVALVLLGIATLLNRGRLP